MTSNYSVIDPGDFTGWSRLNGTNVSAIHIHLYISSSYYRLSELIGNTNITIYDLGIIHPGEIRVLKIVITSPTPIYSYSAVILARTGNDYYEVGRFVLYSGS